jgi:hypothetical protein
MNRQSTYLVPNSQNLKCFEKKNPFVLNKWKEKQRKKEKKRKKERKKERKKNTTPLSLRLRLRRLLLSPLLYFAPLFLSSYQDDCYSPSLLSLFCLSVCLSLTRKAARIRIQKHHRKSGGREREREKERELHLYLSLVFI